MSGPPPAPARPRPGPRVSTVTSALLIPCGVQWGRASGRSLCKKKTKESLRTPRSQAVGTRAEDAAGRRIVFWEGPKEGGVCD